MEGRQGSTARGGGSKRTARCETSRPLAKMGILSMAAVCEGTRPASPPAFSLLFGGQLSLIDRRKRPLGRAGVDLARPIDAVLRVVQHLPPASDPDGHAAEGEQHCEHDGGD